MMIKRILAAGILTCSLFITALPSAVAQGTKALPQKDTYKNMAGEYRKVKGSELLILYNDQTFLCLRNYVQQSDAIIPLCDTLVFGLWNQRETFITLKNRPDFDKIEYSVSASELKSPDSLYFKIILPEDDALHYSNFRFFVRPQVTYQMLQSDVPAFAIPNKMRGNVNFALAISNVAPNCQPGRKCYQRVYFNVFDSYKAQNPAANFFTITLKNFNQCFYEAMDIDGEIIGIEKGKLFWRGNIYEKVD